MAYCTVEDIQALLQAKFSTEGTPSSSDVEEIIEDVAAELDGLLQAAGYTVPVTSPAGAVRLLKKMNRFCAAVPVWHSSYVEGQAPVRVDSWAKQCEGFKKLIVEGKIQLPGVDPEGPNDPVFDLTAFPNRDGYWRSDD